MVSKLCHGPSAPGDKGISLTPEKSARGKFHQIGNEKRACIDWPSHRPGGRLGSWNYAAILQRVTWDRGPQLPCCVIRLRCAIAHTTRGECRFRRRGCGGPGISRQSQAASSVALGLAAPRIRGRSRCGQSFLLWFRNRRSRLPSFVADRQSAFGLVHHPPAPQIGASRGLTTRAHRVYGLS